MPRMEGFEMIGHIKKQYPMVKIIAISGGGRIEPELYLEMASQLKTDCIFKKSFSKEVLLDKIAFYIKGFKSFTLKTFEFT